MKQPSRKPTRTTPPPAGSTLADFRAFLIEAGRSPRTVDGYWRDLALFAKWFEYTNGQALTPQRLTPTDIREYRQRLLNTDKALPATINRRLAALRAYVAWALETNQIEYSPVASVKGVDEQTIAPKWLDKQAQARLVREVERALGAAHTPAARRQALRDQAIVLTLLNTGLRISELCALDIDDVTLSERKGELRVRAGKGLKARTIPLNNTARHVLRAWLAVRGESDTERLFIGKRGALQPNAIQRSLAEYGRRAQVELTPHTLRHTFGKNLIDAQVSIEKVAALLGHSNLNTTRLYTLPSQADLDQGVTAIDN
jgi:site-specific recombinase XerC